jgi:hypothetical protein
MAAIDKIYGSGEQWDQLAEYLAKRKPKFLNRLYPRPEKDGPISNFSKEQDMWLLDNCPLEFVVNAICEQYNIPPLDP